VLCFLCFADDFRDAESVGGGGSSVDAERVSEAFSPEIIAELATSNLPKVPPMKKLHAGMSMVSKSMQVGIDSTAGCTSPGNEHGTLTWSLAASNQQGLLGRRHSTLPLPLRKGAMPGHALGTLMLSNEPSLGNAKFLCLHRCHWPTQPLLPRNSADCGRLWSCDRWSSAGH